MRAPYLWSKLCNQAHDRQIQAVTPHLEVGAALHHVGKWKSGIKTPASSSMCNLYWLINDSFTQPFSQRIWSNSFPFPSHSASNLWVTILSVLIPNCVAFFWKSLISSFKTTFCPLLEPILFAWAHQQAPPLIFLLTQFNFCQGKHTCRVLWAPSFHWGGRMDHIQYHHSWSTHNVCSWHIETILGFDGLWNGPR